MVPASDDNSNRSIPLLEKFVNEVNESFHKGGMHGAGMHYLGGGDEEEAEGENLDS
jgi:hypothetical protein